jgi:hypothetical protein
VDEPPVVWEPIGTVVGDERRSDGELGAAWRAGEPDCSR